MDKIGVEEHIGEGLPIMEPRTIPIEKRAIEHHGHFAHHQTKKVNDGVDQQKIFDNLSKSHFEMIEYAMIKRGAKVRILSDISAYNSQKRLFLRNISFFLRK